MNGCHFPSDGRVDRALHLHGFDDEQPFAFLDCLIGLDRDGRDHAGQRGADMAWVIRVCLQSFGGAGFERAVAHRDFARLAVQLEEHQAPAVQVRIADGQELDDQRLALFDVHADFIAGVHAVEEHRRGQHAHVGMFLL